MPARHTFWQKIPEPRMETQLLETLNDTLDGAWHPQNWYFHHFYIFNTLKVLKIYVKIGFSQKNPSVGLRVALFFFFLNLDSFNFLFHECLVTLSSWLLPKCISRHILWLLSIVLHFFFSVNPLITTYRSYVNALVSLSHLNQLVRGSSFIMFYRKS